MRSRTTQGRHAILVAATLLPGIGPRWVPLALAALLALAAGTGAAPPVVTAEADCYAFTLLKEPKDGRESVAFAINTRGQVAGGVRTGDGAFHAVLWDRDEVRELGTLGGRDAFVTAINEAGDLVGSSQTGEVDQNGVDVSHAFLYRDGRMLDLGTLGGWHSHAAGINAAGQIVGIAQAGDGAYRPVVWQEGAIRAIDVPGPALGINRAGQVVGHRFARGSLSVFVWQEGKLRDLGRPPGANNALPSGLNDAGEVLVGAFDGPSPTRMRALVWHDGTWVRDFDPTGQWEFSPYAINNAGQVVGSGRPDGGAYRGLRWDANGDRHDLVELACRASADWTLFPRAINDAGQIVGWARRGDSERAFLLTPPDRR
jgi:probable HAF family extracellular repeat protein